MVWPIENSRVSPPRTSSSPTMQLLMPTFVSLSVPLSLLTTACRLETSGLLRTSVLPASRPIETSAPSATSIIERRLSWILLYQIFIVALRREQDGRSKSRLDCGQTLLQQLAGGCQ